MSEDWQHIEITDHGTIVVLRPVSDEGRAWLEDNDIEHGFHDYKAAGIDSMIKRPVLETGKGLLVGFKPEAYKSALG